MATMGLPKSASVMPVARQRARAPAMLRPWVDVAERSGREVAETPPPADPFGAAALTGTAATFLAAFRGPTELESDACAIRQVWQREIPPQLAGLQPTTRRDGLPSVLVTISLSDR